MTERERECDGRSEENPYCSAGERAQSDRQAAPTDPGVGDGGADGGAGARAGPGGLEGGEGRRRSGELTELALPAPITICQINRG